MNRGIIGQLVRGVNKKGIRCKVYDIRFKDRRLKPEGKEDGGQEERQKTGFRIPGPDHN
jgi:hypothetical protein